MPGFSQPGAPEVRLGTLIEGGLAPAIRVGLMCGFLGVIRL
jgi:hypothetical protein